MDAPADGLLRQLAQGSLPEVALAELGEPDPPKASEAFGAAAQHMDLRPHLERWAAPLLRSARPGFGARCLLEITERYRQTRRRPLAAGVLEPLARVLGASDFLARLLQRHSHWIDLLEGSPPPPPSLTPIDPDWTSIRIAKYQGLLRIAARDLMGRPFEQSLTELSQLADACVRAGFDCAAEGTRIPPPTCFALGKLGGSELNFSSDLDLLFLYDASSPSEDVARNPRYVDFIRSFKRNMEVSSEDGFAYRIDLDLRPEGRRGTLANSVEAALRYYETFGAEWERQALIRLRAVAGPEQTAQRFVGGIRPFVYRRGIDLRAIQHVGQMKARIEAERRRGGRDLEVEIKEGPGGIRDVEFLVQALQLFYGGHQPSLRTGNVPSVLRELGRLELLPGSVASALFDDYLWLRRAEHAVQMVEERQTQRFPRDVPGQIALARRMGYDNFDARAARDRLLDDWTRVRASVRMHFENLVLEVSRA